MEDRLTKSHNRWLQVEGDALLGGGWKLHNQFFVATHALDWRNFEGYTYNAATEHRRRHVVLPDLARRPARGQPRGCAQHVQTSAAAP